MLTNQHISQQFEKQLQDIRSQLLAMGGLVERQVSNAMQALLTGDTDLARDVISGDDEVNKCDLAADESCISIIALRQPSAGDLRLVTVISKIITDLERVGDESVRIAKMALNLSEKDRPNKNYRELRRLGMHVETMLRDSLDAFARQDADLALKVAREDNSVDEEYESLLRQLMTYMMEDPRKISRAIDMMWSARALERIGDHSRNIAEHTIYLVKGKDVRHLSIDKMEQVIKQK
ncbi:MULTISPECIES: phosphate signaling complex protein PhoU [unclassified Methylophaga]|jgi:phosphate transport system protein|uniref:phosphate signaling complex protein PhoU n=1 Tax=unclassified Methylophaga TaxID=2629249 RepID=UPI000C89900B|nr:MULTISPECIES: phosphate signaling complex protein PhoU [unclassified Methylophaga]MAK66754.1 phosphate transport system regulatory protein PhoU [Methylophaga sp.]MAY17678.1 phosphate transport system regulatory protein PhoU [Methylophaga sp.]MBN47019.1 phosphate transport system regulatory protein PhoU [Methylophaga sp.]HAO25984.1 phosphate transport system regulatory protein PhoU [Methylophaga sp.]HCD06120.1 phosphate transport system regulatory protein PhoU [Methylophaga sp.]|tara:strand:- start:43990 stop:44697 length:708 start_codon:yes stop_codon:yes gene_type:complete